MQPQFGMRQVVMCITLLAVLLAFLSVQGYDRWSLATSAVSLVTFAAIDSFRKMNSRWASMTIAIYSIGLAVSIALAVVTDGVVLKMKPPPQVKSWWPDIPAALQVIFGMLVPAFLLAECCLMICCASFAWYCIARKRLWLAALLLAVAAGLAAQFSVIIVDLVT
jgi:hypothetical protein